MLAAYDADQFHVVYQRLSQFVSVELSSQYHDSAKDRLYTDPANSACSTQTALCQLVTGLCRLLAPILPPSPPMRRGSSSPAPPMPPCMRMPSASVTAGLSPEAERDWSEMLRLRERVLPSLEKAGSVAVIGKSLEARVTLAGPEETRARPALGRPPRVAQRLPQLQLQAADGEVRARVAKADGVKCERCWHWESDVGNHAGHPTRAVAAWKPCNRPLPWLISAGGTQDTERGVPMLVRFRSVKRLDLNAPAVACLPGSGRLAAR